MKKFFLPFCFLLVCCHLYAQDTINTYDELQLTGITFDYNISDFDGEYQILFDEFFWLDLLEGSDYSVSYNFECVSFPFIPYEFNIDDQFSDCLETGTSNHSREFIVLEDYQHHDTLPSQKGAGYLGDGANGKEVFMKTNPQTFKPENDPPHISRDATLASCCYTANMDGTSSTRVLPHSVIKVTLNVHDGLLISDSIIIQLDWIYDNTRGRMKLYPFVDNNNGQNASKDQYDVIFAPKFLYEPDGQGGSSHSYYGTNSNSDWFTGAVPPTFTQTLEGSISYYMSSDVPNEAPYYPESDSMDGFPEYWFYPAPYALLTAPLLNYDLNAYAGFDDTGHHGSGYDLDDGIEHTYEIDQTIDLTFINNSEKIIYNPSYVTITSDLTFPEDYKFLTAHGKYPDKAWVNENNPGFTDLRDVLCPSDQIDASGDFLSTYKINATLTIEETVTIMDAILDGSGTIEYYPDNIYGNFKITTNPDLVFLSDTVTVSDSLVTWENVIDFEGDVILVDSGSTLNIENTLTMAENSKIVVKRGAKLIVDDALITCTDMWKGIEVWGTKTATATTVGAHGKVYIQNNATIKNALYGVRTIKMDYDQAKGTENFNYAYSGGQVFVYNGSTFKNCLYGVYFYEYDKENASIFSRAKFETSESLLTNDGFPEAGIYMTKVKGVAIKGCTFINSMDTIDMDIEDRGKGIRGLESTFTVDEYENASGPNTRTVFENLHYGIYSSYLTSNNLMTVENSNFIKNWRGIYASAMDAGQITLDSFLIDQPFVEDGGCGLYLDNCTGYHVEGNEFYSIYDNTGLGIVVHNSGEDPNEIYRNSFSSLDLGISCQEQNRNPIRTMGLQLLCNEFDVCEFDIAIQEPSATNRGINDYQGVVSSNPENMAGNLFYVPSQTADGDNDDLSNEGHFFRYVYPVNHDPYYLNVIPVDFDTITIGKVPRTVSPTVWTYDDDCPSQITSGGGYKNTEIGNKEKWTYFGLQAEVIKKILTELVDGGNTEGLDTEVLLSSPPETMEIYNLLISESPYLSETVVETAIEKDNVLVNAMVRDIMVANPHSTTSDQILEKLDERFTPMPDYMKAQILEARNILDYKEELESKLSGFRLHQAKAYNGINREHILDTINPSASSDSLLAFYQSIDDKNVKYHLAFHHLQRGEFTNGLNEINAISEEFTLSYEESIIHNSFVEYFSFLVDLLQHGNTEFEVTENEILKLKAIEESGSGKASKYAQNFLLELNEISYLPPIQITNNYKSKANNDRYLKILRSEPPSSLGIFPNPGNEFVIFEYHCEIDCNGTIEVKNVNGIVVDQIRMERLQDQITINTQDWNPGLYIATLIINGKPRESCKFTIIR